jgi:hypothetical protein
MKTQEIIDKAEEIIKEERFSGAPYGLNKLIQWLKENERKQKPKVSECCGNAVYKDEGICTYCKEPCKIVDEGNSIHVLID